MSKDKLNIFLSAYACEPDRGSEPGVGWRWANGLAERVNLTVLTRESNREAIEKAVAASAADSPLRQVSFLYHDLHAFWLRLKRQGLLPIFAYYVLWQWSVRSRFRQQAEMADVVHHLTFCNLLCPGFWNLRKPAFVIGPVGAPLVPEVYLPLFGKARLAQSLRGTILRRFDRLPILNRILRNAAVIIPANSDTAELLQSKEFKPQPVMLDTGAPDDCPLRPARETPPVRFLYAGRLERRKGIELSLRALALADQTEDCWRFVIVGGGPDRGHLEWLSKHLGIAEKVDFVGTLSHRETLAEMAASDVFLFTSLRDTSAGVNLEAMACGLPVVCLSHQGVGDITDDTCADRVAQASVKDTVAGLAAAIVRQCRDSERRKTMGQAARERANTNFSWDEKFDRMVIHYREGVQQHSHSHPWRHGMFK